MSNTMLNEFVEKIIVHERDSKGCVDTEQQVDIYLNFIGEFEIPKEAIDPAILAEQEETKRKKEARRQQLHENYLRLKAAGKIEEYEQRKREKRAAGIPPRPIAKTDEEKAARDIRRKEKQKEYGRARTERERAKREAQQQQAATPQVIQIEIETAETPKKKSA